MDSGRGYYANKKTFNDRLTPEDKKRDKILGRISTFVTLKT